jgi:hypothetical protein
LEIIPLQVDDDVARAYYEADPSEQRKIQQVLNSWLKQTMKRRSLDEIIQDMQSQAKSKGLTQEILDEILADE